MGARSVDVAPVGAVDAAPPFGTSYGLGFGDARGYIRPEDEGPAEFFRLGAVVSLLDEAGELGVGDCRRADTKAFDFPAAQRRFAVSYYFGLIGAQERVAAWDQDRLLGEFAILTDYRCAGGAGVVGSASSGRAAGLGLGHRQLGSKRAAREREDLPGGSAAGLGRHSQG